MCVRQWPSRTGEARPTQMDSHAASRTSRSPSAAYQRLHAAGPAGDADADTLGDTQDDSPAGARGRGDGQYSSSPREQQRTQARHRSSEVTSPTNASGTHLSLSLLCETWALLWCSSLLLLLSPYDLRCHIQVCKNKPQRASAIENTEIASRGLCYFLTDERSVQSGTDVDNQSLSGIASNPIDRCSSDVWSWNMCLARGVLGFRNTAHNNRVSSYLNPFYFHQMESSVRDRSAHRSLSNLELERALDGSGSVLLLFFLSHFSFVFITHFWSL